MIEHARPWKLIAPWYYWQRQVSQGVAKTVRETRPAIQKFEKPNFADGFMLQPQHWLVYGEDDFVYTYELVDAPPVDAGPLKKFATSLWAPRVAGKLAPKKAEAKKRVDPVTQTGVRKLFLDIHKRYYGVVCELHCDAPGLPRATFDQVCQAGFVVRKRLMAYEKSAEKEARALIYE